MCALLQVRDFLISGEAIALTVWQGLKTELAKAQPKKPGRDLPAPRPKSKARGKASAKASAKRQPRALEDGSAYDKDEVQGQQNEISLWSSDQSESHESEEESWLVEAVARMQHEVLNPDVPRGVPVEKASSSRPRQDAVPAAFGTK